MKTVLLLLTLGLWLGCTACQSGRYAASASGRIGGGVGMQDNATASGHAESALVNYRQVLADPGPF